MQKLLNKSHSNVHTIAYILGGVSIFGYLVSFLRDRAFAHYFGAGELLDVYVASFRIPDVLFIASVAFISVYALLPMFEERVRKGHDELQKFINAIFYFLVFFLIIGSTVLFFTIPFLGKTLFSSFSGESLNIFILFSRVYLIQASLFAISAFFTTILQLKRKFLLYSILPILYNAGIIFGVIVLYPILGPLGLALGVVLGVLLNVGIQIPVLIRNNVLPHLKTTRHMVKECWQTIKTSIPRAVALLSHTIAQIFIFSAIVSISKGALSIYYFAESLKTVPLLIVGTAYSIATFPILVTHYIENNMNAFRSVIESAIKRLLFFILPMIALIIVLREPLISLLFETGFFTEKTTMVTSTIVAVIMPHALTMSILIICARALYARNRAVMPFIIFIVLSIAEVTFVYTTVKFIQNNHTITILIQNISGLAQEEHVILFAAVAVVVFLEIIAATAMLTVLMRSIRQSMIPLFKVFLQNIAAVIVLVAVIGLLKNLFFSDIRFNTMAGIFAISTMSAVGILFWYMTLRLLKNKESNLIKEKVKQILKVPWKT